MLDFGALPPEINSGRMYLGPGPGPMLAAAAAWDGLAAELGWAASSYGSVVSGLASAPWTGPASISMAAAAAPYVSWLSATAAQAEQTASQARAAVAAYEAAFAMTVPPPVIAANRLLLMTLIATNFFGQNTPAIAATEAHYAEMWAQDAVAMYGYAGSSATASMMAPFRPPAHTTNPAGPGIQAAAVAKAAATPAGTSAPTTAATPQLVSASAVPQALQQLSSSTPSASSTSWLDQFQTILGPGGLNVAINAYQRLSGNLGYFPLGSTSSLLGFAGGLIPGTPAPSPLAGGFLPSGGPGLAGLGGLGGGPVSASAGQAGTIGPLSVPPSWATGASGVNPTAQGAASIGAVRAAEESSGPGGVLRGMPLSGVGRRGASGFVHKYGFRYSVMPRPPFAG
ncbi:MAG: PPE family protein [Mycobacterium sp.]